jgi:hypothetical protein
MAMKGEGIHSAWTTCVKGSKGHLNRNLRGCGRRITRSREGRREIDGGRPDHRSYQGSMQNLKLLVCALALSIFAAGGVVAEKKEAPKKPVLTYYYFEG